MSTNLYDCFGDYMITLAPIYEYEEDDYLLNPTKEKQDLQLDSGKFDGRSTPSSVSSVATSEEDVSNVSFKPFSPVELKFDENGDDDEAVVAEGQSRNEKTYFHFDRIPYIEDVEISETRDMVIVNESHFQHVDDVLDQQTLKLYDGSLVPESPVAPDENENTQRQWSKSSDSGSSCDENKCHTGQDTTSHDLSDLIYHTAYVDDISDEEVSENTPKLDDTYEREKEHVNEPDPATSSDDIPDVHDMVPISPYNMYRVPADIVVERQQETESSDESTTDVESYVSGYVEREVTFTDVVVRIADVALKSDDFTAKENEIMINFPPYFEIATREDFDKIPSRHYTVAPARQEAVYASPKKASTGQREAYANSIYETKSDSQPSTRRDYVSIDPCRARRLPKKTPSPAIIITMPYAKNVIENTQRETGTETQVTQTRDILRITNGMDDVPRIGPSSSDSSKHASPACRGGPTVVQRTLPTSDCDIAITQVSELEISSPPRWASVNSSTRHKNRDPEAVSGKTGGRRSMIGRASSVISEQLEKAVVIAKKYQKQTTIVTILLILTVGALATMLAVFPMT